MQDLQLQVYMSFCFETTLFAPFRGQAVSVPTLLKRIHPEEPHEETYDDARQEEKPLPQVSRGVHRSKFLAGALREEPLKPRPPTPLQ